MVCWRCKNFVRLERFQEVGEHLVLGICKIKMEAYYAGKEACDQYESTSGEETNLSDFYEKLLF